MDKKQITLCSVLCGLAVVLAMVALFVPMVQIVGHAADIEKTIVYNKNVSLFVYLFDAPFWTTAAADVYFDADGPIWLATGSVLLKVLVIAAAVVLVIACIYELASLKIKNSAIRNNVLVKKLAYFVGWLCIGISLFSVVSYSVTTVLAGGYAEFLFGIGEIVLFALGVAIIILAKKTNARATVQKSSKLKNALGFGLTALFAALVVVLLFVPVFSKYITDVENQTSIYGLTTLAEIMITLPWIQKMMGDLPFGVARYLCYAVMFAAAFVFVYAVVGFVRTLMNKKTNWLSARIKRWSMALLVVHIVLLAMVLCQAAVTRSTVAIPDVVLVGFGGYVVLFAAYLPYALSAMVSVEKQNVENKDGEDGWLEENQIPNDVTAPAEIDVTKNLVDEPKPIEPVDDENK